MAISLTNVDSAYNVRLAQLLQQYGPFSAVESVAFPGVYLSMTGWGGDNDAGSGHVAGQYCTSPESSPWFIVLSGDGGTAWGEAASTLKALTSGLLPATGLINAKEVILPNPAAYLRMDGHGITEFKDAGGGMVNCQTSRGPWELFRVEQQPDGTAAIASVAFPGVYLRMDGQGITHQQGSCGGTVNCQYGVGPWEQFRIHDVQPPFRGAYS